jgi:hypothetical protein
MSFYDVVCCEVVCLLLAVKHVRKGHSEVKVKLKASTNFYENCH